MQSVNSVKSVNHSAPGWDRGAILGWLWVWWECEKCDSPMYTQSPGYEGPSRVKSEKRNLGSGLWPVWDWGPYVGGFESGESGGWLAGCPGHSKPYQWQSGQTLGWCWLLTVIDTTMCKLQNWLKTDMLQEAKTISMTVWTVGMSLYTACGGTVCMYTAQGTAYRLQGY